MVFFFLCLISLTIISSKSTHVVAKGKTLFFFMPSNIPLQIYVYVYTYTYICIDTQTTHSFIHSSTDECLGGNIFIIIVMASRMASLYWWWLNVVTEVLVELDCGVLVHLSRTIF